MKNVKLIQLCLMTSLGLAVNSYAAEKDSSTTAPSSQEFLVGTWTGGVPDGLGALKPVLNSQGIYRVRLNADGTMLPINQIKLANPSWLAFSKNKQFIYATNEDNGDKEGQVSALKFTKSGDLQLLNKVKSHGQQPTHAEVSPDNKFLLISNYSSRPNHAGVTVFPIKKDGSLGKLAQKVAFIKGSQALPDRQADGHAHSTTFSPDGTVAYVADLGSDLIKAYHYDADAKQPLKPAPELDLQFPEGSGPRHLIFSKNGNYLYATTEMDAQVIVFKKEYNAYKMIQTQNLTEEVDAESKGGAGLIFSPDQKFLYVGNRKKVNEIVAYSVDSKTGKLTLIDRYPSGGIEPRAFDIDETGEYLVVANVFSNTVSQFKRDLKTGKLKPTQIALQIGLPTDVKFIPTNR
ncbi:lactonase family protein [Acinetobacter sp. 187]|uniref:Lactonase family protein n=1 Tax=Acinetobacter lanii TaxID=2715163 RepID=A0A6G8S488_9GAMM|nr:lactonase family protein [Acinetobacter lanii]NHC02710.1 lactonase family protein [Acinetobacter lanii]QIO09019.1 lactonase family protein [Acinetobacter lanii]